MELGYMLDLIAEHYIYDSLWNYVNMETRYQLVNTPFYHVGGWYDTFCEGNIDAFRGMQYEGGTGAIGKQKIIIGNKNDLAKISEILQQLKVKFEVVQS